MFYRQWIFICQLMVNFYKTYLWLFVVYSKLRIGDFVTRITQPMIQKNQYHVEWPVLNSLYLLTYFKLFEVLNHRFCTFKRGFHGFKMCFKSICVPSLGYYGSFKYSAHSCWRLQSLALSSRGQKEILSVPPL